MEQAMYPTVEGTLSGAALGSVGGWIGALGVNIERDDS